MAARPPRSARLRRQRTSAGRLALLLAVIGVVLVVLGALEHDVLTAVGGALWLVLSAWQALVRRHLGRLLREQPPDEPP